MWNTQLLPWGRQSVDQHQKRSKPQSVQTSAHVSWKESMGRMILRGRSLLNWKIFFFATSSKLVTEITAILGSTTTAQKFAMTESYATEAKHEAQRKRERKGLRCRGQGTKRFPRSTTSSQELPGTHEQHASRPSLFHDYNEKWTYKNSIASTTWKRRWKHPTWTCYSDYQGQS